MVVISDAFVAVAHQTPYEVGAHSTEADHSELHCVPFSEGPQLAR